MVAASIFATDLGHPGAVIESSEVCGPEGRLFDTIRAAGVDRDGRDPIRPFPDLDAASVLGAGRA